MNVISFKCWCGEEEEIWNREKFNLELFIGKDGKLNMAVECRSCGTAIGVEMGGEGNGSKSGKE